MTDNNRTHIKPLHIIFCDDIRREDNGKDILIGVYSGNFVISQLPNPVTISVWVVFERPEFIGIKIPMEFRLLDASANRAMGYGTLELDLKQPAKTGVLALRGLSMMLSHPGDYLFQLKQYDEPWETVGTLTVEVGSPITGAASVPSQPS